MQELLYARHGETVDLTTGHRSRPDTPLTKLGYQQASAAGSMLVHRGLIPDLIVCSMLPRALQSAHTIAPVVGCDPASVLPYEIFNERNWGDASGVPNTEIACRWPGYFETVPRAESVQALQQRASLAARWVRSLEASRVLVVGHGTFGRAFVRDFEGMPFTDSYNGERGTLDPGGVMRIYPQPSQVLDIVS